MTESPLQADVKVAGACKGGSINIIPNFSTSISVKED